MVKQLYICILLMSFSVVNATEFNNMRQYEETAEVSGLKITLNKKLEGNVILTMCTGCQKLILKITAETKAIHKNEEVPLHRVKDLLGKDAVINYDISTRLVKKIIW